MLRAFFIFELGEQVTLTMRVSEINIITISWTAHRFDGTGWIAGPTLASPYGNGTHDFMYLGDDHILWIDYQHIELRKLNNTINCYARPTINDYNPVYMADWFLVGSNVAFICSNRRTRLVACCTVDNGEPKFRRMPTKGDIWFIDMIDDRAYASSCAEDGTLDTDIPLSIVNCGAPECMGAYNQSFYSIDTPSNKIWQRDIRAPRPYEMELGVTLGDADPVVTNAGMILAVSSSGGIPILIDLRSPKDHYVLPELKAEGDLYAIRD